MQNNVGLDNDTTKKFEMRFRELAISMMQDFVDNDGKMTIDDIRCYCAMKEFAEMMFDCSINLNRNPTIVSYITKHLDRAKNETV